MGYFIKEIKETIILQQYLKKMHLASSKINYLIDNKFCFVNENILKRDSILNNGDYLFIDLSNYQIEQKAYDFPISVLYEDDYIIVVNKPAGFIVHSDGEKNIDNTVTNMVVNYLRKKNDERNVYPVHRLDQETTGCLMFTKDIISLGYYSYQFENKQVEKIYECLVEGKTNLSGYITSNIGSDRHQNNKMVVTKNGLPAKTYYEVVSYLKNYSLLKVKLFTGRTHQIRVHLSSIDHPIVGDTKYGSKTKCKFLLLHSLSLTFYNFLTESKQTIKAKLPDTMTKFVYLLQK